MRRRFFSFLFFINFINAQDRPEFRLPLDVEPVHYKIDLKAYLDPDNQVSSHLSKKNILLNLNFIVPQPYA